MSEGGSSSSGAKVAMIGGAVTALVGAMGSPIALIVTAGVVIVLGVISIVLAPLIWLILLFGGGGSSGDDYNQAAQDAYAAYQGDGKGDLAEAQVPRNLAQYVKKAGEKCDAIGPAVVAAQIQAESQWDGTKAGPDGRQGISQLPADVFDRLGEDADDNGDTTITDDGDSIVTQGKYLCELYDEVKKMEDGGQAIGDPLDLTLAAYHYGLDAIRTAGGLPSTDAQGYLSGVRAYFALYLGIAGATPPPTPAPTN